MQHPTAPPPKTRLGPSLHTHLEWDVDHPLGCGVGRTSGQKGGSGARWHTRAEEEEEEIEREEELVHPRAEVARPVSSRCKRGHQWGVCGMGENNKALHTQTHPQTTHDGNTRALALSVV